MIKLGDIATVLVDGNRFTGKVYHVRENGWPCVETLTGHIASGPVWRDHNHERGPRPEFATCGNCGGYPIGIGCYHICFNSIHYYTPEQERYDDAMDDGSDDIRERYAATIEPSQYEEDRNWWDGLPTVTLITDEIGSVALTNEVADELFRTSNTDTDDIPF